MENKLKFLENFNQAHKTSPRRCSVTFLIAAFIAVAGLLMLGCPTTADNELPVLTGTVTIEGTAQEGEQLTARTDLNGSGVMTFQWRRVTETGIIVIGTNSGTYTLQAGDVGHRITVTVTGANHRGYVTSGAVGPIAPAGASCTYCGEYLCVCPGIPVELIGRWYMGNQASAPFMYEFAIDGRIITAAGYFGRSISVSGNTITVYENGAAVGTANFTLSGNQMTLFNVLGTSDLVPAVHFRRNITFTAIANDSANTDRINFVFSSPVAGLREAEISVVDGTGSVVRGALTGSERNWSMAVTVANAGTVTVSVNRPGIESRTGSVTVHPVTWTAAADDAIATTAINFEFGIAVSGLTPNHIMVANHTGVVTRGSLTGGYTSWLLEISVATAGEVWVWITKLGIEGGTRPVAVGNAATEDFTISFADFRDMAQDIPITGPTISLVGAYPHPASASITVSNPELYDADSIRWIFRGTQISGSMVSGNYGETLTLGPRIHGNTLGEGEHFLTLEVGINGVPYSRRITFTVVR